MVVENLGPKENQSYITLLALKKKKICTKAFFI